ncbi:alpha/beta hydrolase [Yoonia sp. 208BN28-4]|uniref:alpha/beta hydrolase n=1 Tax=Yoonia sp. 208BN28-4 TaxID=3126505 RepID=UPI0030952D30
MPQSLSRQQKFWNLYARLMQKPGLAYVRPLWLARPLVTLDAIVAHRTPRGLRLTDTRLTHDDRSVPTTRCAMSDAQTRGTLLYLHGGAFMIGNLRQYRHLVAHLGHKSGQRAVFVDYRMAPEDPYPAALDDAFTAYQATLADPDSGPITLVGDSAGGNLVLALVLRIKAAGLPMPAAVVAFSPIVDLRLINPSLTANAKSDHLVPMSWGRRGVVAYLNGHSADDPFVSPLLGDFTGAPPVLIQYDTTEVLYDDGRMMAQHLRDAGVDVTEQTQTGCTHVWQLNVGRSPEATQSVKAAAAFLKDHLP